jgi:hypothetical protein
MCLDESFGQGGEMLQLLAEGTNGLEGLGGYEVLRLNLASNGLETCKYF